MLVSQMKVYSIRGRGYDSNIFVIPGKKPTVIDTGTGMHKDHVLTQISQYVELTSISQIILTHEHFDHTGGVKQIYDATGKQASIIAHAMAATKIESGESMFAQLLGGTMPKMPVDTKLLGDETLYIGDEPFLVLSTPGHTPGCICLYSKKTKTLFSGDTVFAHGSFGRYDLPGGNLAQLKESLHMLNLLDVDNLYPGHEAIVEGNAKTHINLSLQNIEAIEF